ncbi:MAG: DUF692 family protein [Archangium sp.]|nr:DUF692 family protein [Archangium sp.]MDP3157433.1 DUF692 family protein [Archangium sp.]MDP3572181.1 DUF692 family protein [Archangium sp.]
MSARAPLGFGVGLRPRHYREFLESAPAVDWVEAISENFMGVGGRPLAVLEKVRRDRPVVLHGVSLGIGSAEPLDPRYLKDWQALIARIEPAIVSDHLCWGRAHGRYSHDLLPAAFTEEAVRHVVDRVTQVQDFLGRRIALENVSSYLTFVQSELTEWEFLAQVAQRSGCEVLLDVNNIFVSSRNHGFDPDAYLSGVPVEKVVQIHLAGHQRRPELIIDTHDGPVSDEVWALYARALGRFGAVSTLIEWDDGVPELQTLLAEAEKARAIRAPFASSAVEMPRVARGPSAPSTSLGMTGLQQTIFSAICDPTPVSAEAEALIAEHPPLSAKARIEVYAEMYWLRMRDVLRDSFPTVRAGVGDENFDALVADFLRVHPSTHPSLDRLGQPFPAFLETARPDWADVAALEWARAESFIAPDGEEITFAQLQEVPPELWGELTLRAHPSVRVLVLESDPQPVLRAQRDGLPLPALVKTPTALVVWRKGFVVFHAAIAGGEAEALQSLVAGAELPVLLSPFEELDDGGVAAFEALQSWFSEGMVSSLSRLGSDASRDERAD